MNNYHLYKNCWITNEPPHLEVRLTPKQAADYLRQGGWMLRNCFDFDCSQPTHFWFIIKDSFEPIEQLPTKVRNMIRRANRTYTFRLLSPNEILQQGYPVYLAAMKSYRIAATANSYQTFCKQIISTNHHMEYWGAINAQNDQLVAFSINRIFDDCAEYQTMKAIPEDMHTNYVYYGLINRMNEYYLKDKKLRYVLDGARSITKHSNIQPFLIERFGFRKAYCHMLMYYSNWLEILLRLAIPFRHLIPNRAIQSILNQHLMQTA